jgi:hypothetical protein
MSLGEDNHAGRPIGRTMLFGVLTAGCYGALFLNADTVMRYFTRGAWYAALPIATAFLFSFVHGAFASNLWSLLGIEARKTQKDARPRRIRRAPLRRRPRPQPRLSV